MPRPQRFLLTTIAVIVAALAPAAPVVATESPTKFIWPTSGRITQQYGCTGFWAEPRRGSCAHFHMGVDIANARGTPIRAAADGVLSLVGWDPWLRRDPDWMVIINHGQGVQTMYAHLRPRQIAGIRKGVRVHQGEIIGYMDMSGMATGVHLHWAVIVNHNFVSPYRFVSGKPVGRGQGSSASSCTSVFVAMEPGAMTAAVLEGDGGSNGASCATA